MGWRVKRVDRGRKEKGARAVKRNLGSKGRSMGFEN
jgi:hypothetical protein